MADHHDQDTDHTDHEDDDYAGSATLVLDDTEIPAEVQLRGYFQPIDGYYHWYGRVRPNETLAELASGKKKHVEIRTPEGAAFGEVSDPDPWGRYRISGTSTPPFRTPVSLADIEG